METIQVQQQVVYKQALANGLKMVKVGTVIAMSADKKTATVAFPGDNTRRTLPVAQLSTTRKVFGRDRVQVNSGQRLVDFLR